MSYEAYSSLGNKNHSPILHLSRNGRSESRFDPDACERIIENLVAQDPTNLDMQSRLASNLHSIGIVKGGQGDHVAELEALYAAEGIWERLINVEPRNFGLEYSIMDNYNAIGDAMRVQTAP